jgi:hypothetical protein
MNTEHIPEEITKNINFDWNNEERIKEINDTFCQIHELDDSKKLKSSKDYRTLINEINGRYDAEMLIKKNKIRCKESEDKLKIAKDELQYFKDKISNSE